MRKSVTKCGKVSPGGYSGEDFQGSAPHPAIPQPHYRTSIDDLLLQYRTYRLESTHKRVQHCEKCQLRETTHANAHRVGHMVGHSERVSSQHSSAQNDTREPLRKCQLNRHIHVRYRPLRKGQLRAGQGHARATTCAPFFTILRRRVTL
jgi:hypothetical protein